MKNNIILIAAIILSVFFQSCGKDSVKVSGNVTTKEYDFTDFSELDISDDFKAYVTFSDTEELVSIEADDNLHEHIVVEMNGDVLEIRLKNNLNIRGKETLNAIISAPRINAFQASGDAEIYLQNELEAERLEIKLSGDSKFDGALDIEDMQIEITGDSKMKIVGAADKLNATIKGDSKIEDYSFSIKDLIINLSGDSEGQLTVTETIDVKATGDSFLYYKGEAVITRQDVTDDSKLVKVD